MFTELGLHQVLADTLHERGYAQPTAVQTAAIPLILDGQDVMAGARTGTGKTAAFVLPLVQRLMAQNSSDKRGDTMPAVLILTPTRELAQQVFKSARDYGAGTGVRSCLVYGGASLNVQIAALQEGVDLLVATPGRLLDLIYKGAVDLSRVESLVFDEADRMLDMGFIGEIRQLLKKLPEQRQTLLFSATFDDAIFKLSKSLLNDPEILQIDTRNSPAEGVEQKIYEVDAEKKHPLLSYLIGSNNWQQVLVFTRTKQAADYLARELTADGLNTKAVHGDKSQGARERELEAFREGDVRVLVATDVAARGLDIDSLNYVVNYQLPHNAEDYIHRIGRTGRAGREGLAVTLMSQDELHLLEPIEILLDEKLNRQWYPGFEPDLNKPAIEKTRRPPSKKQARAEALGLKPKASGKRRGRRR
ncbi:DEAD/DEAH box helicase [Aliamphritea hakodatensis]|uniref:DEAD/DEAH box helicase n=1 Tax=Aliamphritea hakodatensis TaxID=2895352 RepID=UPI0022FD82BF|nr:DEAD/DEAH box helicase [Aliamphritea hakodatensis]